MPIVITEEEKTAIQDYFNHPERYMSEEVLASLPGGVLPDGSKVSRAKFSCGEDDLPRQYIIHAGMDGEARYIPISTTFLDDPGTHAATMVNAKIYFHQNKDDLPRKLPDNFEDYCEIDEDDDPEDESILAYRAAWAKAVGRPDYALNDIHLGVFKKTVKYAVDIEGNVFYLKSHASLVEGGVSLSGRAEQYAPRLYMGPTIFRRTLFFRTFQTKRIEITRDAGENLDEFMLSNRGALSSIEIELLAREILKQYLVQINDKGIVHTDIKGANICVKTDHTEERRFEIVFIDWDEAFSIGRLSAMGSGTPGYMAPEFFKTTEDFEQQLDNRAAGLTAYCHTLKSNDENLFSQASDIYALGIVLLDDLRLEPGSCLYLLAHEMCHNMPNRRPTAENINEALERAVFGGPSR